MSDPRASQTFERGVMRKRLARAFVAADYPDFLHRHAGRDIAGRFDFILRDFATALVIADKPDDLTAQLEATGKFSRIIRAHTVAHAAGAGLPHLVCDEENLAVAAQSLDCVVSVLNLQHANDLPGALIQIARSLRPDGLFVGAMLGGATLNELRHCWLAAEGHTKAGASPRVAPFADIRDMGALLQRAGFALPVVDADRITVTYRDALSLMRELKAMGLSNALGQRSRALVSPKTLALACSIYEETFAGPDGRIPATFEFIYLTGWAPHDSQQQPLRPGSAKTRLADALSTTEQPLKNE